MLSVELDHILSEEDVAQKIQDILAQVENDGEMYVITKNSRPVAAIVNINQLSGTAQASVASAAPVAPVVPITPTASDDTQAVPDWNQSPSVPTEEISEPELPQMPPIQTEDVDLAIPPAMPQTPEMPEISPVASTAYPAANEPYAAEAAPITPPAPVPTYTGSSSPMAEEPPEDVEGPLIKQIPVVQNPPTNLPPLSGAENLQAGGQPGQSYGVPEVPQS